MKIRRTFLIAGAVGSILMVGAPAHAGTRGIGLLLVSSVTGQALGGDEGTGAGVGLIWAGRSFGAWTSFEFTDVRGAEIFNTVINPLEPFSRGIELGPSRRLDLKHREVRRLKDFSAGVAFRVPQPGARPFARIGIGWYHDDGVEHPWGKQALDADHLTLSVTPNDWGPGASVSLGLDGGVRSPASPVIEVRAQATRFYDVSRNLFLSVHAGIWYR